MGFDVLVACWVSVSSMLLRFSSTEGGRAVQKLHATAKMGKDTAACRWVSLVIVTQISGWPKPDSISVHFLNLSSTEPSTDTFCCEDWRPQVSSSAGSVEKYATRVSYDIHQPLSSFINCMPSWPVQICSRLLCQAAYAFVATRTFTLQTDPPVAALYPMIDLVNHGVNMPEVGKHQEQKPNADANMDSMAMHGNPWHISWHDMPRKRYRWDILRHAWKWQLVTSDSIWTVPGYFSHGDW